MTAHQPTHDHAKDEAALRSLLEQLEERTRQHERDFTELTAYRNTGLEPEHVSELKSKLAASENRFEEMKLKCDDRGRTIASLNQQIRAHKEGSETGRQLIWHQADRKRTDGILRSVSSERDQLKAKLATASRELVELRERAEGAESKLRLYDSGSHCCDSELKLSAAEAAYDEAVTALKSVTGIHEVQLAGLRASLAAAEAKLAEVVEAAEEAGWNGVENSKHLPTFILAMAHERDEAVAQLEAITLRLADHADKFPHQRQLVNELLGVSTTPAEQPGRAGLSVDEALSVINRGGMVTDKGGDSWFFMHGAPHWLDDKDEWIYSSKDTMREHAPFKVTKEPTP